MLGWFYENFIRKFYKDVLKAYYEYTSFNFAFFFPGPDPEAAVFAAGISGTGLGFILFY